LRYILAYPETNGTDRDLLDGGDIGVLAKAAEDGGWWGFALTEHPAPGARWLQAGGHQTLDPFIGLAFAAAATTDLRLLTYLTVLPYRNPLLLAKTASTLDRLSGGRFILGVGTGYLKSEFFALGVDFDERNALFDETLDVLPLALSGEPFSYKGRHFEARDVVALPKPSQPRIPVWIGGNSALTLRRVVAKADGWMPLVGPPELAKTTRTPSLGSLDELAKSIAELRASAGDRGDDIEVAYGYIDPAILEAKPDIPRQREALAALAEIGVDTVIVTPFRMEGPEANLRFIGSFMENFVA
jgi:probable F420-dependent oxidoreductase